MQQRFTVIMITSFASVLLSAMMLVSCNHTSQKVETICGSCGVEEEMQRASNELARFDTTLTELYNLSAKDPKAVIWKTDRLIKEIKTAIDSNHVRWNKLGSLYNLRTEVFYNTGQFQKSIAEIYKGLRNDSLTIGSSYITSDDAVHLACNYVKLKDFGKAKIFVDSIGCGYYIYDFIAANYYEVLGEKGKALKAYQDIESDKSISHYDYYSAAIKRIEELKKSNPKLLTELFYPTSRPDRDIGHFQ